MLEVQIPFPLLVSPYLFLIKPGGVPSKRQSLGLAPLNIFRDTLSSVNKVSLRSHLQQYTSHIEQVFTPALWGWGSLPTLAPCRATWNSRIFLGQPWPPCPSAGPRVCLEAHLVDGEGRFGQAKSANPSVGHCGESPWSLCSTLIQNGLEGRGKRNVP